MASHSFEQKEPAQRCHAGRVKAIAPGGKRRATKQMGKNAHAPADSNRWRYRFGSCLRSIGGGLGQFWPILLPICRAQVFAGYVPTGGQLNGQATADRDRPNTSGPLPYKLWLGVNCAGQPGLTAVQGKISGELHSFSISESLNQMQEKNEAWRIFFNLSASLLIKP